MRVLIVGLGGVSRAFRNWPERTLGRELVKLGHEVHALTYRQPDQAHLGLAAPHEVIDGIQVHRVRPQFWPAHELGRALAAMPRPDVAHIMHPRNVLAFGAVRWLRARGIPVVWTWLGPLHDRWLVENRERPLEERPHPERLITTPGDLLRHARRDWRRPRVIRDHWRNYAIHAPLRQATAFVPCSQHEADLVRQIGFSQPATVVPLWLDMDFMRGPAPPLDLAFTRPLIPYIGQLTTRKCFDLLVAAMPAIVARFPAATFVFVTHNPAGRATLTRMAEERGVAANLRFLGTISEEQKLALLRASDVLPVPSRYEGFGLPLLEGMAAGTPVVSTAIPVVREIVTHGVDGLLAPYDDAPALAAAMLAVLEDSGLRERLVDGGRLTLATRFDPAALARQVAAVYAGLVG